MEQETLTLQEALLLLELPNLESITESDLPAIRRKAFKRWHPDTIAHTNPSQETVKRFERNFRLIDHAIAMVESYLRGEIHSSERFSDDYHSQPAEDPVDIIRRNAKAMQELLRKTMEEVAGTRFKVTEEFVVLSEGFSLREALDRDLEDNITALALTSLVSGLMGWGILGSFLSESLASSSEVLAYISSFAWISVASIHVLACLAIALPLSRFWLPIEVSDSALLFVNSGICLHNTLLKFLSRLPLIGIFISIPVSIVTATAQILRGVVIQPSFLIAGLVFKDQRICQVKQSVKYYASVADWYVNELLNTDPSNMNDEQLYNLSYLYGEYRDIWKKWQVY
ncbi:hypothetical protein [Chlorogloeopsis sp. ULAP02]|uniref:hypothetical protein n=1 Tax=Chlorogloeopsis sp. ULAP02 TaxID=3107926 RepID=UPI003134F91E